MIRACFSEQQYKKSKHCHDETEEILMIEYQDIGKENYQWIFKNTEYIWPAHVEEKRKTKKTTIQKIMPFMDE